MAIILSNNILLKGSNTDDILWYDKLALIKQTNKHLNAVLELEHLLLEHYRKQYL